MTNDELTLKDYFAAQAMQALIQTINPRLQKNKPHNPIIEFITTNSYIFAEEMLKARREG